MTELYRIILDHHYATQKRLWCWEGLGAGGEGDDRRWDGWMASPTRWTWVWVNSGSWWWTGRPGMLQFIRSQRGGHDWVNELNWTDATQIQELEVMWGTKVVETKLLENLKATSEFWISTKFSTDKNSWPLFFLSIKGFLSEWKQLVSYLNTWNYIQVLHNLSDSRLKFKF